MHNTGYFRDPTLQEALESANLISFDMNGLIIDDEAVQFESVNRVLAAYDLKITERYWIERCVGKRADAYFTAILQEKGAMGTRAPIDRIIAEKNTLYHSLIGTRVNELIRPGVREILDYLCTEGRRPLALCTSAHQAEIDAILGERGLNFRDRFTYIVSGTDVYRSKPDPETYDTLAYISNMDVARCLVFEDSGLGVQSAVRAGMVCIAVPNRFTAEQDFHGATFIIDNLTRDALKLRGPVEGRR
jgi:HAD superfamily hydrolase (TIGR01509 family)